MTEQVSNIPTRLKNASTGGHVCGTDDVFDDDLNQTQKEINSNLSRVMGGSGNNHSKGLVPDPGSTSGTTKFLREDGSWKEVNTSVRVSRNCNGANKLFKVIYASSYPVLFTIFGKWGANTILLNGLIESNGIDVYALTTGIKPSNLKFLYKIEGSYIIVYMKEPTPRTYLDVVSDIIITGRSCSFILESATIPNDAIEITHQ